MSSTQAAGITWAALRHGAVGLPQSAIDSGVATSQVKHRFSEIPRIPHVAKSDLGTKRICPTTGKKFYDLNKNPVISPYTGEVVPIAPIAPPRAARGDAARGVEILISEVSIEHRDERVHSLVDAVDYAAAYQGTALSKRLVRVAPRS